MKKKTTLILFLFLMVFFWGACSKKSALEGKVVDGKGQPLSGLKVIAKQVQPIKGYEQFEATTASDGSFEFKKLYPSSEYIFSVWHKDWSTKTEAKATTGPEGEMIPLKNPIQIVLAVNAIGEVMNPQTNKPRFVYSGGGVVADEITGLEWMVGPDIEMPCGKAKDWCVSLSFDGSGGWRLPTIEDLESVDININDGVESGPVFLASGWAVWAIESENPSAVRVYYFRPNLLGTKIGNPNHMFVSPNNRVVALRSQEDRAIEKKDLLIMKEQLLLKTRSIAIDLCR